jgi:hypothetical protein
MIEFHLNRDILNKDPTKRKKITGLTIWYGLSCLDACWCDCGQKCKYGKSGYWYHNFSVRLHTFFEYKLHIKLPHLLYIGRKSEIISGTEKCPFRKSKRLTCWDCKYGYGRCGCRNEKYHNSSYEESKSDDPEWPHGKCKFFEKYEVT